MLKLFNDCTDRCVHVLIDGVPFFTAVDFLYKGRSNSIILVYKFLAFICMEQISVPEFPKDSQFIAIIREFFILTAGCCEKAAASALSFKVAALMDIIRIFVAAIPSTIPFVTAALIGVNMFTS